MDAASKREFVDKLNRLNPGDPRDEVIKLLGVPHFERTSYGKMDGKPRGIRLQYYLKKIIRDQVNEKHDEYVTLCLDMDGRLVRIGTNIPGLKVSSVPVTNVAVQDEKR